MIWMLCSAVYLTLYGEIWSWQLMRSEYNDVQRFMNVVNGILAGAIVTGAITLGHMRYRFGPPLALHPGHWLLVISASISVVWLAVMTVVLRMEAADRSVSSILVLYCAMFLVQAIAYFIALNHLESGGWRFLFAGLLLLAVLHGTGYLLVWSEQVATSLGKRFQWGNFLLSISHMGDPLIFCWAVMLTIRDLLKRRRRDWLHWLGVATFLGLKLETLSWIVASWLIPLLK
jgi:hypothetical protein